MDLEKLTKEQKLALLEDLEEQERRERECKFYYAFPDEGPFSRKHYTKALEFFKAGNHYRERAFIAGNRVGKSFAGAYELTCHLTGLYPEWWEGKRFDRPIVAWAAGKTNETTRDILQEKLLGAVKQAPGTGLIPKDLFAKAPTTRPGVPDAVQDIFVTHVSGGISKVSLKSYQQGRESFEGATLDVIWLDEEPSDQNIYSECLTRTATTKGIVYCTFTPLLGLSDVVLSFLPDGLFPEGGVASATKYVVNVPWSESGPHLDDQAKAELRAGYAPHELEARTKGIPSLGSGRIYPVAEDDIVVEPFKIPQEWPVCFGMDVGWSKTAVVWGALDPNTDCLYLYDEYYRGQAEPAVHVAAINARGTWIMGAIDYAGVNQASGERLMHQYIDLGLKVFAANKSVEAGLLCCYRRMTEGKLKVFKNLQNWLKEFRVYRRDEKGNVVKANDHLMDATRYLAMSGVNAAMCKPEDDEDWDVNPRITDHNISEVTGY